MRMLALYCGLAATPFFLLSADLITNAANGREAAIGVLCGFAGIALTAFCAHMIGKLSR